MSKQSDSKERNWYAIHTYSGYENVVVKNIKQRTESLGMKNLIFDVVIPMKKQVKIKGKKRVVEEEKIYPGYVLIDMIVTDQSWYIVRNTPRVTGFVGAGVHPVPVTETEMGFLLDQMKDSGDIEHDIDISKDDLIMIIDGPFKDTEGKVLEYDNISGQVKVSVSMFGRDTQLELDLLQIKKL